jgi:hypothetical protein
MRGMATFAPGLARLLGGKLVRSTLLMGSFARLARLLRIEFVSGALLMGGFTALAGYLPLLIPIH